MAIADKGTLGIGVGTTNVTTVALTTTTTTVDVGDMIELYVVADNTSTTDGDNSEVSGVSDTAGNTYAKLAEYTNSPTGVAADGVTVSAWQARATVSLAIGSTITVTFGAARLEKVVTARVFTVSTGATLIQSATAVTSEVNGASHFGSSSFSGLSNVERLYLRCAGKEANTTTALTTTASYTNYSGGRSQNLSTAVTSKGEFRIVTGTGDTSNPTLVVAGDTAGVYIALEEFTGGPSIPVPVGSVAFAGLAPTAPIASTAPVPQPGRAVLTVTTYAPVATAVATVTVMTPGAASLRFKGPQATSPVFLPASATLTFTSVRPALVYLLTTVPPATLTLSGELPVRLIQPKGLLNIPSADLTLEGQYVGQGIGYLQAGSLTVGGLAPSLRFGVGCAPPTKALTLTAPLPRAQVSAVMTPLPAVLTLTTVEPETIFFGQLRPATAILTFTGPAPQAALGTVPSPVLTPLQAALTLTGPAPSVLSNLSVPVPAGSLTVTGRGVLTSTVGGNVPMAVPAGSLTLTSGGATGPGLKYFYVLTPAPARLRLLGPDPEMAGIQFGTGKPQYPAWQSVVTS